MKRYLFSTLILLFINISGLYACQSDNECYGTAYCETSAYAHDQELEGVCVGGGYASGNDWDRRPQDQDSSRPNYGQTCSEDFECDPGQSCSSGVCQ